MKILHLEPLALGGYPSAALTAFANQNPSKRAQDFGEPKSVGEAPHRMNAAPTLPSPGAPTTPVSQRSLTQISSLSLPSCIPYLTNALGTTQVSDQTLEAPESLHFQRRFFHSHLTEAIRKRRIASAWHIYEAQKNRTRKDGTRGGRSVPTGLIHSLFALLAGARPQTRLHYIRMKELAEVLKRRGHGNLREWEWNALVNAAGRGFRKTTSEDYHAATAVLEEWEAEIRLLKDMGSQSAPARGPAGSDLVAPSTKTYNTLISIAARTGSRPLYQDALRRLERFAGTPDAVTYLARITHYRKKGQLDQIPPLLEKMTTNGWPLQTDGANAVIWAYASNGQLDIARQIYDTMIAALPSPSSPQEPPPSSSQDPLVAPSNPILSNPFISIAFHKAHPNHRTYIMMLQAYAQAGQLAPALDILQDYLTAISAAEDSRRSLPKTVHVRAGDKQVTAAFRGLFLGFVKHGNATTQPLSERAFVRMSLKEAASALLLDMAPPDARSQKTVPDAVAYQFSTESLLSLFRFYIILTTSYISEANHPILLPPAQFVRTILLAFKNTAPPETASSLLNDVWRTIVIQRLEPCGKKWVDHRHGWVWAKVRRDFGVNESTESATLEH